MQFTIGVNKICYLLLTCMPSSCFLDPMAMNNKNENTIPETNIMVGHWTKPEQNHHMSDHK